MPAKVATPLQSVDLLDCAVEHLDLLRRRPGDVLVEVFRDGTLLVDQSFDDVRARAAIPDPSTLPLLGSVAGAPPSKSCCVIA